MTGEQLAEEGLMGFRWWSPADLLDRAESTVFRPRTLPALLGALLLDGVPVAPVDLDA